MNKDIISKIKELAYDNVNKKIEEEKRETERKINNELKEVEEILKYIGNKLLFKKIGNSWKDNYILVTEEIFFEDYNKQDKWNKGIFIIYEREKKWDAFIKVNGECYYDVRYIIRHYEEDFDKLNRRLNNLISEFNNIEEIKNKLLKEEPKIKNLIEQYQQVEIIESSDNYE